MKIKRASARMFYFMASFSIASPSQTVKEVDILLNSIPKNSSIAPKTRAAAQLSPDTLEDIKESMDILASAIAQAKKKTTNTQSLLLMQTRYQSLANACLVFLHKMQEYDLSTSSNRVELTDRAVDVEKANEAIILLLTPIVTRDILLRHIRASQLMELAQDSVRVAKKSKKPQLALYSELVNKILSLKNWDAL